MSIIIIWTPFIIANTLACLDIALNGTKHEKIANKSLTIKVKSTTKKKLG